MLTLAIKFEGDAGDLLGTIKLSDEAIERLRRELNQATTAANQAAAGLGATGAAAAASTAGVSAAATAAGSAASATAAAAAAAAGAAGGFTAIGTSAGGARGQLVPFNGALVAGNQNLRRFTLGLGSSETAARRMRGEVGRNVGALNLLQRAFHFIIAGLVVRGILRMADAWTVNNARIGNAVAETIALGDASDALFESAQETGTAFSTTAQSFQRFSFGREQMERSSEEVIRLTNLIEKLGVIGGGNVIELEAATIQLAQGIASGELRAEELRSVMEQFPALAEVIAASQGAAIGDLKRLGEAGALTPKVIADAVFDAAASIEARFAAMEQPISRSFTRIANAAQRYTGELFNQIGVTAALGGALDALAENFELVADSALVLLTLGLPAALRGISIAAAAAARGVRGLNLALRANPIIAVATAIAAAATALIAFGDDIRPVEGSIASLHDFAIAAFDAIGAKISEIAEDLLPKISAELDDIGIDLGEINDFMLGALVSLGRGFLQLGDVAVNVWNAIGQTLFTVAVNIPSIFREMFANVARLAATFGENFTDLITGEISFEELVAELEEGFISPFDKVIEELRPKLKAIFDQTPISDFVEFAKVKAVEFGTAWRLEAERLAQATAAPIANITPTRRGGAPQAEEADAVEDFIRALEEELQLLGLEGVALAQQEALFKALSAARSANRKLGDEEKDQIEALVEQIEAATAARERANELDSEAKRIQEEILTPLEAHRKQLELLDELLASGRLNAIEHARAVEQAGEAYLEASRNADDLAGILGRGLEDALADSSRGFESLEDIGLSVLEEIQRSLLRTIDFAGILRQVLNSGDSGSGGGGGFLGDIIGGVLGGFFSGGTDFTNLTGLANPSVASAHGNLFGGAGQLITTPTLHPTAGGLGIVGEGPRDEVVAPVVRMPSGNVGIETTGFGGGGGNAIVIINDQRGANAEPVQQRQSQGPNGEQQIEVFILDTVAGGISSGKLDRPLSGSFGLRRAGTQR